MSDPRRRAVVIGVMAVVLVWVLAWGGYRLASHAKMTPEKFTAQVQALDLNRLNDRERAKALADLAANLNRLPAEDRRRIRLGRKLESLFADMTEAEKEQFLEATLPTGFKQMLTSFEQMPDEQRQRAITNALNRLRRDRDEAFPAPEGTNQPPVLSEELQRQVILTGLKTFYSESSAQTKAELAPLLEELQRMMESGRLIRRGR